MLRRLLLMGLLASVATFGPPAAAGDPATHVIEWRRIGESVHGRAIWAFRVGDPEARVKAVLLGAIHGDEPAGMVLARAVKEARPFQGVDLWVVPTINPDGVGR
ncbi:MAG TPA: M14 family zinc carboxypeptidase, partial [Nocardioidaceae bacterium]|nr:M14 family zinc carboxypeptidase [Nocardioidaceae bacterium]